MDSKKTPTTKVVSIQPTPEEWREIIARMNEESRRTRGYQEVIPNPVTEEEALTRPQPQKITDEEFLDLQAKFRSMI